MPKQSQCSVDDERFLRLEVRSAEEMFAPSLVKVDTADPLPKLFARLSLRNFVENRIFRRHLIVIPSERCDFDS